MATLKEMIAADIAKRKAQQRPGLLAALGNSARVIDDGLLGGAVQRIPGETNRLIQRAKAAPGELNALAGPQMRQQVYQAMSRPQQANPKQWMDAGMELSGMAPFMGMVGQTVYHGSPHKFDKFDMSKIGTGEGAQAYGHGLYMAENPATARVYQKSLAAKDNAIVPSSVLDGFDVPMKDARSTAAELIGREAFSPGYLKTIADDSSYLGRIAKGIIDGKITAPSGNLYKVDIPDETIPRMLDWDKPLSEQHPSVQAALRKVKRDPDVDLLQGMIDSNAVGGALVKAIAAPKGGDMAGRSYASELLKAQGIPGIRYLDGNSRGAGGTSNYVLFDDQLPRILETNGVPSGLEPWAKNKAIK